jgi:hypothetical protein
MDKYTRTSYWKMLLAHLIEGACEDLAVELAIAITNSGHIDEQRMVAALRQPVSIAAVIADLSRL